LGWLGDPSLKQAMPSERLPALDVLRGVAILGVIWHHLYFSQFPSGWWFQSDATGAFLGTWASNGWLGVSLFFVLSGFVLYLPFASQKRTLDSWPDVMDFYRRRALRLLPLYFFGIFALLGLTAKTDLFSLFTLLTLTFNFHIDTFLPSVNVVLWSLGIEFWFSVIFPALVLAIAKYGLLRTAVVVFVMAIGVRTVAQFFPQANYMGNPSLNILANSLPGRLDDFFVGMVLATLYARGRSVVAPVWIFLAGVVLLTLTCIFHDMVRAGRIASSGDVFVGSLFQAGAAAIIMAALSMKNFRCYPLELLGLMCYSLYFWHGWVINHTVSANGILYFVLILAGFAWLSYRYIEHGHVKDAAMLLPHRQQKPTLT
jgi:peptidoglycan/LPS O-acetylase OafA/YrhL